jgi:uncharacterized protein
VSDSPLAFLDANILFSTALGGPAFQLLLDLARDGTIRLTTSRACVIEAATNLERKRPGHQAGLVAVLESVSVQPDVQTDEHHRWAQDLVDPEDVHVFAGARRANADVLLTGDTTHFGPLMERNDLGLSVRTLRAFLLDRPSGTAAP